MKKSRLAFLACAFSLATSAAAQEEEAPRAERKRRVRLLVNGAYHPTGLSFSETATSTSFLEQARSRRSYDGGKGIVFEVGAIIGITGRFGAMGSVEFNESDFDGVFEESLPHPLYFDRPRNVEGALSGLQFSEKAIHFDAVFTHVFPRFTVDLFGGPTFFFTNTEILDAVTTTSSYPFDEAAVSRTSNVTLDDNPVGFNAGGAVTWRWTEVVGLAFQARFSRATIEVARSGGESVALDAGGFRAGGGIRFSF